MKCPVCSITCGIVSQGNNLGCLNCLHQWPNPDVTKELKEWQELGDTIRLFGLAAVSPYRYTMPSVIAAARAIQNEL